MKTPIRATVGAVGPDRFVRHVEVRPFLWKVIWRETAPQARKTKVGRR